MGIALHDSHYYKTHTTICILQVPLLTSYKHNTKMLKGKMGIALHDSHYYKTYHMHIASPPASYKLNTPCFLLVFV